MQIASDRILLVIGRYAAVASMLNVYNALTRAGYCRYTCILYFFIDYPGTALMYV